MKYNIYCWGRLVRTGVPAEELKNYSDVAYAIEAVK